MLKRKIDKVLQDWHIDINHKPLIVRGARQVGKTASIMHFAKANYKYVVEINFALQKKYKSIFIDGYEVNSIIKNITLLNPTLQVVPNQTLIFFDEIQDCPDCSTCLKSFCIDKRYDVICSGSIMGLYYNEIESNSVGYKDDYEMHSMDFEEFLWAKGYTETHIDNIYYHLTTLLPFSELELSAYFSLFNDYMLIGGMPEVVNRYIESGNFSGVIQLQQQLLRDYEEDITKYAIGLDKGRILAVYRHISTFLAQDNKKFQVSKIAHGARNREYMGCIEWLANAGIINTCFCLNQPQLPLKGNYNPQNYKIYFRDTGLLIASLDEESQEDLRANRNFGTYKGAIYENVVGDMLVKQGYELYFYRNDTATMEIDFFIRNIDSLIPVEVKASDSPTISLRNIISSASEKYKDIRFGIKLCRKNIGFNGQFYTIPYFATFLLRRFLRETALNK